jgi:hypothetical protein
MSRSHKHVIILLWGEYVSNKTVTKIQYILSVSLRFQIYRKTSKWTHQHYSAMQTCSVLFNFLKMSVIYSLIFYYGVCRLSYSILLQNNLISPVWMLLLFLRLWSWFHYHKFVFFFVSFSKRMSIIYGWELMRLNTIILYEFTWNLLPIQKRISIIGLFFWRPHKLTTSKAWTVFAGSNTGIVSSNPNRGINFCVCLFRVCVVLCVGRGLATGLSPVERVLPTLYGLTNWRSDQDPQML